MTRMATVFAAGISAFAVAVTLGVAAASAAPAPSTQTAQAVAADTPWVKYGVYSTEAECGRVGHYLVDHDKYKDYTCSRELAGWGLWVHN